MCFVFVFVFWDGLYDGPWVPGGKEVEWLAPNQPTDVIAGSILRITLHRYGLDVLIVSVA